MTSSSSPPLDCGLDAMLIVYSLLGGHPAAAVCEQLLRSQAGWFTTTFTLFEVKVVLTKVYGVDPRHASRKLTQLATGPLTVLPVDPATGLAAIDQADVLGIDLTDAVLLQPAATGGQHRL